MRLGLVSDIHASYPSLVRAFDILAARAVARVVCMGDIVHKHTDEDGEATVALLREHWVTCVRGNHDVLAVRASREQAEASALSADAIAWLDELPAHRAYVWDT